MSPFLRCVALLCLLPACASTDMALDEGAGADGALDSGAENLSRAIRIDVLPSGDSPVLAQSRIFAADAWQAVIVDLQPTLSWSGQVVGFRATPYDITVPGEARVPVVARVEAIVPGQRGGAAGVTDSDGTFSLQLPAGEGYRVSVLPDSPALLPFLVLTDQSFDADLRNQDLDLGYGQAVSGRVAQDDGSPLPATATAWLEQLPTGVAGPRAVVDSDGFFMLRALPGDYRLVVSGAGSTSFIPTVTQRITVTEDGPVRADVSMGRILPLRVDGRALGADGRSMPGTEVRFAAVHLRDAEGSAVVAASVNDREGTFTAQLLPGEWTMEILPPYEPQGDSSPLRVEGIVVDDAPLNLDAYTLPERVPVEGVVFSAYGDAPAPDVLVTATEADFGGNVYSTRTDADGRYRFEVTDTALEVSFSPPTSTEATTWVSVADPRDLGNLRLATGSQVSGVVRFENEPVAYSLVEIRDGATGALYATALTATDGTFSVRIDHQGSVGDVSQPGLDTGLDTGR